MKLAGYRRTNIRRVRKPRRNRVPFLVVAGAIVLGCVALWVYWLLWIKHSG